MQKKWFLAVILVLSLVFLALLGTGCGSPVQGAETRVSVGQQPEGFWVSGTGEITVTPNLATVWLGIQSQETSVSEAQSKTAAGMKSVLQSLADSGVNQKDIQTGSFSINQRTRWEDSLQKDRIIGYTVTNMLTVKVRDVNKAGDIIDAAIKAGGDLIRINNLDFSVEEPAEYYKQAREKAIANARDKAEQYARLAGVKLGSPTYIVEGSQQSNTANYGNYYSSNMSVPAPVMLAQSSGTSISPGQNKIVLNITVSYEIIK